MNNYSIYYALLPEMLDRIDTNKLTPDEQYLFKSTLIDLSSDQPLSAEKSLLFFSLYVRFCKPLSDDNDTSIFI